MRHILNVTREIDNFFPGMFDYFNVRVYDDEKTDLLKHWDNTFKYISRAKMEGSKVLVHCKMGISRSASVVIAYAMKAYNMEFEQAIKHVKEKRNCIKPNKNFLNQLETYQGILEAMKNKEKLQRSKSETNLKCNENAKDGKTLPGSEPTPLIQALQYNRNTYPSSKKEDSQKRVYQRPSSWSPDIVKSSDDLTVSTVPANKSLSLENLVGVTAGSSPEEAVCETTNMRLPCKNGQNFSITQNKILFLEDPGSSSADMEISNDVPFVSELEQKTKDDDISETNEKIVKGSEAWDPGEQMIVDECQPTTQQVWTCSAEIIHQEPFAQPHQPSIEIEEKKRTTVVVVHPTIAELTVTDDPVSRQSSCSSVDSACIMGEGKREAPSRNSSWGSGDNRQAPSRNSSWSSYDIKAQPPTVTAQTTITIEPSAEDVNMGQSGIFPYDKDEIPWHPGTVKRTKQKIEEKQIVTSSTPIAVLPQTNPPPSSVVLPQQQQQAPPPSSQSDAKNNNQKILCDIKKSRLIDSLSNLQQKNSNKAQKGGPIMRSASYKTHARCKSEEMITRSTSQTIVAKQSPSKSSLGFSTENDSNNNNRTLSTSAPGQYCMNLINNNNDVIMQFSAYGLKMPQRRQNQLRKHNSQTIDEPADKKSNKNKDVSGAGKLQNLKEYFESKALNPPGKNCQSLPSSPIAIHIDVSSNVDGPQFDVATAQAKSNKKEDINVRVLVDKFDRTKMRHIKHNSTGSGVQLGQKGTGGTANPIISKQRPKSMLETMASNKPHMINHSTVLKTDDFGRPPPIPPPQMPVVRNALMSSNNPMQIGSLNQKANAVTGCKKIQQGRSHPLSKLAFNKRLNTTPAYNTM